MEFDPASQLYAPFYCEENVWQLAKKMTDSADGQRFNGFVLFFIGAHSYIAMKNQVAFESGSIGFWDYHVVLFDADNRLIFDQDSRLGCPVPVQSYIAGTFPDQETLAVEVRAKVRSIPSDEYLSRFSSDRSHMLDESGIPIEAFPKWPAIVADDPIWLNQYRCLADIEGSSSEILDLSEFAGRFGSSKP